MKQILSLILFSCLSHGQAVSSYVNPLIGTGGHGHTFPGATAPFGMVQLSPDTRIDGSWDGCSGYHYSDSIIYGFSHTHLNGTGVSDFGDIMLMPTMGEPNLDQKQYASTFSHKNEVAKAGFYSVMLDDHNIDVALTASTRVGFHKYTFNQAGQANIILDLNHRDKLLQGEVRIIDNRTIEVLRRSEAWARDQYVFARIEFDHPMTITKINNNAFAPAKASDKFFAGTILSLSFSAKVKKGESIQVKVALSPTSYEGAALNMKEITDWNFEKTFQATSKIWEKELSKIEISETDPDRKAIFYTALYHTMIQPNIAEDLDGKYRGRDNQIHIADSFDYYTVFSLWDTFRAAHPLYTLIDKKRTSDFINTFLMQYEQGGTLPVWELASNETGCMIGYHSVSVIADAIVKGIKGFDYENAYEACRHSAMLDHLGMDAYKKNGFIAIDDEHESVSKTLEYAYDDWCIGQIIKYQGYQKLDDYAIFMERAQNWQNIFDYNLGFMRPKRNGGWETPFDPREVNNNFTEGNSWQYSFFVPQDINGMIAAYGINSDNPKADFEKKLDALFTASTETTGREQVDITGLIGQYAHGNEPSHHMAYLYNFVGKPEKTREKVHYILNEFYKNSPDGLIGNEDCGQMSAWYVLSSMGIYPITPGKAEWSVTEPLFQSIKINFEDGSTRTITKNSTKQELKYFGFEQVAEYVEEDLYRHLPPVPVISASSKSFSDSVQIQITSMIPEAKIWYRVIDENTKPDQNFILYKTPFNLTQSSKVESYIDAKFADNSKVVSGSFLKKPNNYSVSLQSVYNQQYHAGGADGLTDGIFGSENWRKGDWQGYQSQDFECIVDLKKTIEVRNLTANFLQDSRSWILMPTKVEFYTSADGLTYNLAKVIDNLVDAKSSETIVKSLGGDITSAKVRYIKVRAYNFGKLPEWHQGFGGDAFIFIDEITIR